MRALDDVLQFEALRGELQAIADQVAIRFARSSLSPVIREYLDFSTAVCLPDGRMLAQGFSLPLHLGAMPRATAAMLERFPEGLDEGDLAILNDPYSGGMHLPDIFAFAPAHLDGELLGYLVVVAHHIDIGGRVPGGSGADSREIFEEGLRLPPVKLYRAGVENEALWEVIRANVRIPDVLAGDLAAQVSGCRQGGAALTELVRRHGLAAFRAHSAAILDHGRRSLESELRDWPEGRYEFSDVEDHDGISDNPVRIHATVTIADGRIEFDFTGSAPQVAGSINATLSFTESACYAAVRALAREDLPVNAGFMEQVTVTTEEATIVHAAFPAGVAARGVIGYRVIETIYGALSAAMPDRVPAAGDGGTSGLRFGGFVDGKRFQVNDIVCGAWGARPAADGIDGAANMAANVANRSAEEIERDDPMLVRSYGLVDDTGGAGRYRGGMAVGRALELLAPEARLSLRSHRNATPPYGLHGGHPGATSKTWLVRDGERQLLPAKVTLAVQAGDVIEHHTASGGGVGDPALRDRDELLRDVRDGKVSVATARDVYGVTFAEGEL
ncbi:hydantoinase B/oxoprolinase family protein [Pseudonocardia sp. GCM10023141]|uniref:hydantoinase B/oxoprolinase family protein n=1 Tax=Pseudonocardia sp. GCM10023141 TaxID=3252653 RepID=UPI003618486A